MSEGWLVSAYAAAPPTWDPRAHTEFLDAIEAMPGVAGLELPFSGRLHPHAEDWLLRRLDPRRSYTVTTIPDTMNHLAHDPHYGLASRDTDGRRAAVARIARAASAVRRANDAAGARIVRAVVLHTAPRAHDNRSSGQALLESLTALSEFGWDGARIVVEHCDAPRAGRPGVKGFLALDIEVGAVSTARQRTGADIGISVNWGRSVVECRDPRGADEHLATVRSAGLLAGFTISGCAAVATCYGRAWDDTHVPPAVVCADSALTTEALRSALRAAGPDPTLWGIKVSAPPGAGPATRIAILARTVSHVRRVCDETGARATGSTGAHRRDLEGGDGGKEFPATRIVSDATETFGAPAAGPPSSAGPRR